MKIKGIMGSSAFVAAIALGGVTVSADAHADQWWNCQPQAVHELVLSGVRQFQVECSNAYPAISTVFYAGEPLSGTGAITDAQASRFLSVAEAAIVSGRIFRVHIVDANTCPGASNCRYADAWTLYH